jgi:hypothetical protein
MMGMLGLERVTKQTDIAEATWEMGKLFESIRKRESTEKNRTQDSLIYCLD